MSAERPDPALRRLVLVVPVLVLGAAVLAALAPLLLIGALIVDLVTGWRRRRHLRLVVVIVLGVWIELMAFGRGALVWLRSGFGRRTDSLDIRTRNYDIVRWWVRSYMWLTTTVAGASLRIDGPHLTGNSIVLARHTSIVDALLPAWLGTRSVPPLEPRMVMKDDLLWGPCFATVGCRIPNHFVRRAPGAGSTEVGPIEELAATVDDRSMLCIFPEGTFYTPERHERAVDRIAERQPRYVAAAAGLRHVLPPRPAGTIALLRGAPKADVFIIAHTGFDQLRSVQSIHRGMGRFRPIDVHVRRIERAEVPDDDEAVTEWLWSEWCALDRWADDHRPPSVSRR